MGGGAAGEKLAHSEGWASLLKHKPPYFALARPRIMRACALRVRRVCMYGRGVCECARACVYVYLEVWVWVRGGARDHLPFFWLFYCL